VTIDTDDLAGARSQSKGQLMETRNPWTTIAIMLAGVHATNALARQDCGEWTLVDPPADVIAVTEVQVRSADEAWAFGSYQGLIRWDGASWEVFPIGEFCDEYSQAGPEQFGLIGPSHLFLAGYGLTGPFSSDQVLTFWDGEDWSDCHTLTLQPNVQGAPRNGAANVVVGAAIDDVWILGTASAFGDGVSGQMLLTVHWDGSELTEVMSPGVGNSLNTLRDAVVFASDDIWAVGQYRLLGAGTPGYHAAIYHWGGESWDYVPNPAETLCCQSTDLKTVAGVAPDDVWAGGFYGVEPLFMHWDGSSWSIVPGPETTGSIYQMVAIASDDVWAVDAPATLGAGKFYHWDGAAWSIVEGQEIPGAVGVERHGGLAAVGPCDLWAVGSYNFGTNPVLPLIERLTPGAPVDPDVNGDGCVDVDDLVIVILAWGSNDADADADHDGIVGVDDVICVITGWSPCS
jgi:hypothetical protein